MTQIENQALIIVDPQPGFMPATEGERLGVAGFGELPVVEGEQIIAPVNVLFDAFAKRGYPTATTQDQHPTETAHFAEEPNFTTTWPVHCVAGTPGGELHPDLKLPAQNYTRFIKGTETLVRGEDDTSYSGFNAYEPNTGLTLPDWLRQYNVTSVKIGGLALDYCVRATALDIRQKLGIDVAVVLAATRGIAAESMQRTLGEFAAAGVRTITVQEAQDEL